MRAELKFVVRPEQVGHVYGWLKTSALMLRTAHPPRTVRNLYFDTHDFAAMAEKLAGVSERSKVRFRWYGDNVIPGPGVLEVKRRRNALGDKVSFAVDVAPPVERWRDLRAALRAALPAAGRSWLDDHPQPVLINAYRREYFASADGAVRATLDRDLKVFDQRRSPGVQAARPSPLPAIAILELKFAPETRARVVGHVAGLPFVAVACSKYELGVRAIVAT
jgi:hypothetical protein